MVTIREPYWKKNAFGISEHQALDKDYILVECSYKKPDGSLLFPFRYRILSSRAVLHETMVVKGVKLHIIPVSEFEVISNV